MSCFHVSILSCCHVVMCHVWHRAVWEDPGSVIRVLYNEGAVIYHVSMKGITIMALCTVRRVGSRRIVWNEHKWLKKCYLAIFLFVLWGRVQKWFYKNGCCHNNNNNNKFYFHIVINDRSLRLIRRGQRIARIGEMIMMSHVSVSQLGWAELCWAAGGKSNKSRNWGTTRSLDFVEFTSQ